MSQRDMPKSPVFPAGKEWKPQARKGLYESEASALLRTLLQDDAISEDQRTAWERWRTPGRNPR